MAHLVHLPDEGVDCFLTVAEITALNVVLEFARSESAGGVGQLEWPQEVACLLEVGADSVDLVDQILHTDDAVLAKVLLDDRVIGERNALLLRGLRISTLVDKLTDALQVGVAVGNEGLDDLEHLHGGLGQADEDTIVDLKETKQLKSLALLGVDLVDTLDANDEGELGLSWHVVAATLFGDTSEADLLAFSITVVLDVRFGSLEDLLTLLLVLLHDRSAYADARR